MAEQRSYENPYKLAASTTCLGTFLATEVFFTGVNTYTKQLNCRKLGLRGLIRLLKTSGHGMCVTA